MCPRWLSSRTAKCCWQRRINEASGTDVAIVTSMDGFHYYRAELDQMPDPALAHARRGAAFTFNAQRFVDCVRRIADGPRTDGAEQHVLVPTFDHGVGDPVEDDITILPCHRLVIVEGLYVLRGARDCASLTSYSLDACKNATPVFLAPFCFFFMQLVTTCMSHS